MLDAEQLGKNLIKVLVADDSDFMRRALSRRIEADKQFRVIGTAANGREAVERALTLKPDVITLDVEMPVMNGLEALKEIVAKTSIPVVMLSAVTRAGAAVTLEALNLGAVDFVLKQNGAEELHEKLLLAAKVRPRASATPIRTGQVAAPPPRPRAVKPLVAPRICIIGASTGGPQALQALLDSLGGKSRVPIVIAQHMPANFTGPLAARLGKYCHFNAVEVEDGMTLMPGTVYVGRGGMHVRIIGDRLHVAPDCGESPYRPSVDVLGQSALESYGRSVLAVMLTGMGNDGAASFIKLKNSGAHVIAQSEETCTVYGMPRAVVEGNGASEILPLSDIGRRVATLIS